MYKLDMWQGTYVLKNGWTILTEQVATRELGSLKTIKTRIISTNISGT